MSRKTKDPIQLNDLMSFFSHNFPLENATLSRYWMMLNSFVMKEKTFAYYSH